MIPQTEHYPPATFRNFNLCPHCESRGEESLLDRMCEGLPMISRSDGEQFHLFLADQPSPYPSERKAARTNLVSVCFWYAHAANGSATFSAVVVMPGKQHGYGAFFRRVEQVADLLTEKLLSCSRLSSLYVMKEGALVEGIY